MRKTYITLVFICHSVVCYSQANLQLDREPIIALELGSGTSEAYVGLSIPLGKNHSYLSVRSFQSVLTKDNSAYTTNQWYGLENTISLNKKMELIIGLGYLTDINTSIAFDVSPKVGLQAMLSGNIYTGVSYCQFIPRNIKNSYQPLLTLDFKYIILNRKNQRGLVKHKSENKVIFASATFGGYYSALGIDAYATSGSRLGLSARIYTNFGTLFETENHPEWQLLALNFKHAINKEIEITGSLGIACEIKPLATAISPLIGLNLRALIYENLYFTLETSQTSKILIRDRRQPIVHAGLSVLLQ